MKMSNDREWLRKRAEKEDKHLVSTGSLVSPLAEEPPKAELLQPVRPESVEELLCEKQKP
jgi:hypothetical protein